MRRASRTVAAFAAALAATVAWAQPELPAVPASAGHDTIAPLAARPFAKGTVLRVKIPAPAVREDARTLRVYLPPSYDRPESAERRYPVVLLLHGWPGSDGNWFEMGHAPELADSMIARGEMPEVILACPNGHGSGLLGRSFWMDAPGDGKQVEYHVVHDVIAWLDEHYRTVRAASGRGAIGLSDGGIGALNLLMRHPDLFSAAGSHSSDFVVEQGMGTGGLFRSDAEAEQWRQEWSPLMEAPTHAEELRRQTIYMDCGSSDESITRTRAFHEKLEQLGVPHTYHEFAGSHSWGYWRTHLRQSLGVVARALR